MLEYKSVEITAKVEDEMNGKAFSNEMMKLVKSALKEYRLENSKDNEKEANPNSGKKESKPPGR